MTIALRFTIESRAIYSLKIMATPRGSRAKQLHK